MAKRNREEAQLVKLVEEVEREDVASGVTEVLLNSILQQKEQVQIQKIRPNLTTNIPVDSEFQQMLQDILKDDSGVQNILDNVKDQRSLQIEEVCLDEDNLGFLTDYLVGDGEEFITCYPEIAFEHSSASCGSANDTSLHQDMPIDTMANLSFYQRQQLQQYVSLEQSADNAISDTIRQSQQQLLQANSPTNIQRRQSNSSVTMPRKTSCVGNQRKFFFGDSRKCQKQN
eukprot:TRINITY_DN14735_c0_g1_i2.p2 TRINITY_DN14735_c0_g1~~TRINITY_DN14735_c0_g1_i2.p2  ORF type:complete len:229 (+),score=23.35 TRINITY_DN14735_c0_g1_i2:103-789(+)